MKSLKMLGLAVVAAAALMAVIGAGSASATRICSVNTSSSCASPNPTGTQYTATLKSGTEATLNAGFATIRCTASSVGLEQTNAGGGAGTPVAGTITSLSFSSCGTNTVNVLALGSGSVAWTSEFNGSLTGSGTRVETVVGSTKCFYGGEITTGLTVTGGAPASGKATAVSLAKEAGSNSLCAATAKWNAEYVFGQTAYVTNS
ncbi:MAG TPA: hypothetical protein VHS74_19655 [Solirubrobacterales bacterium]|jgi:hypothetical protein|nr:hypothetical protein [Solirubrobacterales bacterium]